MKKPINRIFLLNAGILLGLFFGLIHPTVPQAQQTKQDALPAKPEDGGPRRFKVTVDNVSARAEPDNASDTTAQLRLGDVVSNLGCIENAQERWCKIRLIRGGPKGYVRLRTLAPATGPDGIIAIGKDTSKDRAKRKDFDAQADIMCSQEKGQSLGSCQAGVSRSGGGDATVAVSFPNGFVRSLYFVNGEFMRGSSTMSGVGTDTDWRLEGGLYRIRVDDQRFEISVEFVLGTTP